MKERRGFVRKIVLKVRWSDWESNLSFSIAGRLFYHCAIWLRFSTLVPLDLNDPDMIYFGEINGMTGMVEETMRHSGL